MTKKKIITITIIALLTLSSFGLLFTTLLTPAAASRVDLSAMGPFVIDATPEMIGEKEVAIREYAAEVGAAEATQASPMGDPANIGDEITVSVSDMGLGLSYDETFVVVMDGTNGIMLIEKAAYDSFDGTYYYFANPDGDDSEPWLRTFDLITPDQLTYLLVEFDTNIYPTDTGIFGDLIPRGDEGTKVWVLIHNIRDEAYYDDAQTSYVAGYFSASENAANNKNMFHIDSYDWINRVGPDGGRPYLYEGVLAHEFEHMIHFDIDPDEPSWVDEGLADLAGYLCGYGHPDSHLMYYMAFHAFTSLTFWGGGLEDYGASYLFQLYLYEKFGGLNFVKDLVQEQANGIRGIMKALSKQGVYYPFDWIFDWWTIANYLDDTSIMGGRYGYDLLDIGSADTSGWSIDYALWGYWGEPIFGGEWELSGWWGVPQPYTAHYYRFTTDARSKLYIDGEDFSGTPAYSGTYEWYSGAEAWTWRSFYQTFAVPGGGATLDFMTYYEIEEDWDYGYVEVHDLDTDMWYTLEDLNGNTVDTDPYAQDNPNVPDGREPMDYVAAGEWHAFTGNSGGWIPISMDLTPFAGHQIELHFRMWQDGAFTLQNMYVDDISIPELGFSDDVEAGEDGWTTTGWTLTDGIIANDWECTILTLGYPVIDLLYYPSIITVYYGTQAGEYTLSTSKPNQIYLAIVSNRANHILTSGYVLGVKHKSYNWYW
jgi:hypothetical protein